MLENIREREKFNRPLVDVQVEVSRRHCKTANIVELANGLCMIVTHYKLLWEIMAKNCHKRGNVDLYSKN